MVGWSNYIGLVLGCPSVNYGNASMISALAVIRDPTYQDTFPKRFAYAVWVLWSALQLLDGAGQRADRLL
jgi:hypothetical protein